MGIFLNILANILIGLLKPFAWMYSWCVLSKEDFDRHNFKIAFAKDQTANVQMKHLFNRWFLSRNSIHHFGNPDETISSVLGRNQLAKTLTLKGWLLVKILDYIDPNHCIKAIGN